MGDEDEDGEGEQERLGRRAGLGVVKAGGTGKVGLDSYERALWQWVNVDDLDGFLQEVGQTGS